MDALDAAGVPMCVASSSDHHRLRLVLGRTGLLDRFAGRVHSATDVDNGKPAPDLFLAAARELGVDKERSVVMEDALSGVAAGRAGPFGLVVGVDRGAGEQALLANGADLVVTDLGDLVDDQ